MRKSRAIPASLESEAGFGGSSAGRRSDQPGCRRLTAEAFHSRAPRGRFRGIFSPGAARAPDRCCFGVHGTQAKGRVNRVVRAARAAQELRPSSASITPICQLGHGHLPAAPVDECRFRHCRPCHDAWAPCGRADRQGVRYFFAKLATVSLLARPAAHQSTWLTTCNCCRT